MTAAAEARLASELITASRSENRFHRAADHWTGTNHAAVLHHRHSLSAVLLQKWRGSTICMVPIVHFAGLRSRINALLSLALSLTLHILHRVNAATNLRLNPCRILCVFDYAITAHDRAPAGGNSKASWNAIHVANLAPVTHKMTVVWVPTTRSFWCVCHVMASFWGAPAPLCFYLGCLCLCR